MKIIAEKQLWKYLFWFGPFLFSAGLTAGIVSDDWGRIPSALLISGIAIIGLWIVWQSYKYRWWERRSTQASTNALIATLAVLAILGLVNFLGYRYHTRVDLTETQLFTLAPQSRELIHSLQQPVKVWLFDVTRNPQDQELLENYRRNSSKFNFEYVDPQAKPGLADKFGVKDYGPVYLEYQNKRQLVQVLNENERLSEIRLTNGLQQITSSTQAKVYFLQGHGEHQLKVGEGAISQAVRALGDKNYITAPLNLSESNIPEDAAVIIVAGAKRGLLNSETQALQDYLNKGGSLLLMIDPNTDIKIDNLLAQWGVELDYRLAIDKSGEVVGFGPAVSLVTEYGEHPITKGFGKSISLYRLARPIETRKVADVEATPLLITKPYPDTWAESDLQSENLQFHEGDRKGPLTLGVALTRKLSVKSESNPSPIPTPSTSPKTTSIGPTPQTSPTPKPSTSPKTTNTSPTPQTSPTPKPSTSPKTSPTPQTSPTPKPSTSPKTTNTSPTPQTSPTPKPSTSPKTSPTPQTSPTPTESRMVVIGNSDFATDGSFGQQLNGDVFLNSVTWLSQQDQQSLSIRPKEVKNRRINLTTAQAQVLSLSSVLVLPIIALTSAIILWWLRR